VRTLGVVILLASSATASADPTCRPTDFYSMVGLSAGLTTTPVRDRALGFELGMGLAVHQCGGRGETLLELRIGPTVRYLDRGDVGGVVIGGDVEVSYPLDWHDTRLGGHVQLGIAGDNHTQALFFSAAGARLRYHYFWVGLDIIYTHGNHVDYSSGSTFSNRSGSGAILGAGFEGPAASIIVPVATFLGGFLLLVNYSGE
jgi:hypothetical protein